MLVGFGADGGGKEKGGVVDQQLMLQQMMQMLLEQQKINATLLRRLDEMEKTEKRREEKKKDKEEEKGKGKGRTPYKEPRKKVDEVVRSSLPSPLVIDDEENDDDVLRRMMTNLDKRSKPIKLSNIKPFDGKSVFEDWFKDMRVKLMVNRCSDGDKLATLT